MSTDPTPVGSEPDARVHAAAAAPAPPSHAVALPGGPWHLWRSVCVRSAGFPATRVLALAAPEAAAAADRVVDADAAWARARRDAVATLEAAAAESDDARRATELRNLARTVDKGHAPARAAERADVARALERLAATQAHAADARAAADRVLAGPATSALDAALRDFARDPLFREALVWQNAEALRLGVDRMLADPPGASHSKARQRRALVASYLQRYCVKNDTIGFFGPVGWARAGTDAAALTVRPGARLLASREVFLSDWGLDALAAKLGDDARLRPWLAPRIAPYCDLAADGSVRLPGGRRVPLTAPQARLLAACDGERTAREAAAAALDAGLPGVATEREAFALLDQLRALGVLIWTLEMPASLHPEREMRRLLARVEDAAARGDALARLGELEAARDAVARAAGDPAALERAVGELEATFERLTGQPPRRGHGAVYAARTLFHEDCRRDVAVTLGAPLLARLGPPLALVLASARWMTVEIARRFDGFARGLLAGLPRDADSGGVELLAFQSALLRLVGQNRFDTLLPPAAAAGEALRARWAEVLELEATTAPPPPGQPWRIERTVASLGPRVEAAFGAQGPAWTWARYFSPDVMIAARDAAAVARGEYALVLGELHVGPTMLAPLFVSQHPEPDALARAVAADIPPHVATVVPKQLLPHRVNMFPGRPDDWAIEFTPTRSSGPRARTIRGGELLVDDRGDALTVRSRDGRVTLALVDVVAELLTGQSAMIFGLLPAAPHSPRVTIDGLVVARERWRCEAASLAFARAGDAVELFAGARAWARSLGLPRHVFVKAAVEKKPVYLDLDSPLLVEMFAKLARRTAEGEAPDKTIAITEMLPGPEQCWLIDAEARHYTSELRFIVIDATAAETRHP